MGRLNNKKVLLPIVGAAFAVLLLVGCSCNPTEWFGPKELETVEDQKKFMDESADAMKEQDSYKMEGSMTVEENGEEMTTKMKMVFSGEDYESVIEMDEMTIGSIALGEDMYIAYGDTWVKMTKDQADEGNYSQEDTSKEDLEEDMYDYDDEDWEGEGEDIKYEGIEEVDGVQCYKFSSKDENGNTGYMWIGASDKLIRKVEMLEGEQTGTIIFTYDDVSVSAPDDYEDYTDLSDEELAGKMMELIMGGMGDLDLGDMDIDDMDY